MAHVRLLLAVLLSVTAGLAAQSPAPLPDEKAFFAEARKRLASNDLLMRRYAYRERSTELHLNPFGRRVGTNGVQVYEVYPHPEEGLTYRRLVEDDGRALSPAELEEQDRRYRDRLQAWQRRLESEGTSGRALREKKAAEARERDAALAREALDLFDFTLEGRDTWERQPAIVVRFAPRPGASPRSREGRVARAFAGRAWIHEFDYEVMNVEATALDDVSFGWGMIAKLYKGSTARFTRRRFEGGWLPVETRFEGTGRALLFRKVTIDFARDYYDYTPFDIAELPARLGWAP
jgi:hypothetical protein